MLYKILELLFGTVEIEKRFDWLKDPNKPRSSMRLDFYIEKLRLAIEFDGEQHFRPSFTGKWESVETVRKRDQLKDKLCREHGIKVVRFNYKDILTEDFVKMKIYAELQGNELVEHVDKKPHG